MSICETCVHLDKDTCPQFGIRVFDEIRQGCINCSAYKEVV